MKRWGLAIGLAGVMAGNALAFEEGTILPSPDLVLTERFALPQTELAPEVRVVVFFYSASWCRPCRKVAATLRETYADFRTRAPGLEFVTYALDDSPRQRADYLREQRHPWPALGPAVISAEPWLKRIPGGTPQFQAFAVENGHLRAITSTGAGDQVVARALAWLANQEIRR